MNEFETAVVNEPSVFEPLKFYCIFCRQFMQLKKVTITLDLLYSVLMILFCQAKNSY